MPNRRKRTPQKDATFLRAIAEGRTVQDAAALADYGRDTLYSRRERDPEWRNAWDEAKQVAIERMEAELDRRAFQGVERPIMYRGVVVESVREYSDLLAIARLRALAPDKYRDSVAVEVQPGRGSQTLLALLQVATGVLPEPREVGHDGLL